MISRVGREIKLLGNFSAMFFLLVGGVVLVFFQQPSFKFGECLQKPVHFHCKGR